jgi:hypothetical protein
MEVNMHLITGVFDTYEHAAEAVNALKQAGITHANISFISRDAPEFEPDEVGERATTGAEIGAGLGAAGGLLAGLGIVAIPGLGPVVAGGWLFATAIGALAGAGLGAATGGLVGALAAAGVPEADAHVLAEAVKRGGAIVTVRVDEPQATAAAAVLRDAEGMDIEARRRLLEEEGWTEFVEDDPPHDIDREPATERTTQAGPIV